jgi:hypothetical protein
MLSTYFQLNWHEKRRDMPSSVIFLESTEDFAFSCLSMESSVCSPSTELPKKKVLSLSKLAALAKARSVRSENCRKRREEKKAREAEMALQQIATAHARPEPPRFEPLRQTVAPNRAPATTPVAASNPIDQPAEAQSGGPAGTGPDTGWSIDWRQIGGSLATLLFVAGINLGRVYFQKWMSQRQPTDRALVGDAPLASPPAPVSNAADAIRKAYGR